MNPNLQNHIHTYIQRELIQGKKKSAIFRMIADDENNKMKVLIDGDGMKLLMDVWQEYVSDDDYVNFPDFMRKVDNLLLGFRGGKPLTKEERQEMNEAATPKKRKGKKKKAIKPVDPSSNDEGTTTNTEMAASDFNAVSYYVARQLKKKAA